MKTKLQTEQTALKIILWVYILLCLIIAGLNFGYAKKASPEIAHLISSFWHFYENALKTIFILLASFLTLRILKNKRTIMRKANLKGIILTAFLVHILGPLLFQNQELYFFTLPLPWSTTALQLLFPQSSFYLSRAPVWGFSGVAMVLGFYIFVCVVVFVGTMIVGRRWQCSTLCLFNGFASEVFAPVFPLVGKKKPVNTKLLSIFKVFRWIFLVLAFAFTLWWCLFLTGVPLSHFEVISQIEVYKYLVLELLAAMFFWIVLSGRGYCYYCPLGTVLGWIGKACGQHIATTQSKCILCNQCNQACPMSIDIKSKAQNREKVTDQLCVGCGHCIDICPSQTLRYQTTLLK